VNNEPKLLALDAMIVELFEPQKFVVAGENSATAEEKFSLPNLAEAGFRQKLFVMWR
jgi:hypothetical protein